jgi:hypothetical protein
MVDKSLALTFGRSVSRWYQYVSERLFQNCDEIAAK